MAHQECNFAMPCVVDKQHVTPNRTLEPQSSRVCPRGGMFGMFPTRSKAIGEVLHRIQEVVSLL